MDGSKTNLTIKKNEPEFSDVFKSATIGPSHLSIRRQDGSFIGRRI